MLNFTRKLGTMALLLAAGVCLLQPPVAGADSPGAAAKSAAPLADFIWKDVTGRSYAFPALKHRQATVFFFSSTQCPLSNIYTPRMIEIARDYAPKGVGFFLVNANREDDAAAVKRYAK